MRVLFALAYLGLAACRAQRIVPSAAVPLPDVESYAIYSEVIDSLFLQRRSAPITVVDSTILQPPVRLSPTGPLARMLDSAAPGLTEALAAAGRTQIRLRPAFGVAGEVAVMPRAETAAGARRSPAGRDAADPTRRYPGAGIVSFSAIGFAPDQRTAALYAEHLCGPLCGGGYVVVLARGSGGRWQIRSVSPGLRF